MKWYIDALDPRSGRAFASYRDDDLQDMEHLDAAQGTYFLEPPAFDPVQVSRSIAFSATRYQFQAGLFDGEGELPFDELDDVVEFIRRSYLRRGGGSGGGPEPGGSPEPLPRPTEGGGETAAPAGQDPLINLREIVKQFGTQQGDIRRGAAQRVGFIDTEPKGSSAFAKRRLGRGALVLALEQIAVFQLSGDFESSTRQRSRLLRLFQAIVSAGLAEEVYAAAAGEIAIEHWLTQQFNRLKPFGLHWPLSGRPDTSKIMPGLILAFLATGVDDIELWPEVVHELFYEPDPWRWFGWHFSQREDDPVGLLAELAVPAELADDYKAQADAPMSVGQFLFSFLAAPQLAMEKSGKISDLAIEVALFASACLVLPSVQSRLPEHSVYRRETNNRAELVAFEAEKWLRGNMPQKIFSKEAEALLTKRDQMAVVRP
ncbi:hypothetical protein AA12717_1925 [Gluconacetobacter sacchari DSM 12717]|uniref:Uncharacterized protein n=2 Tax=Gluconacetobacter sacchari TaxID=92759 RepID=A0A7W4IHA4_9PROT|nr:hypothetical protein [Gluconacetobacter sacchari]MBB2162816.1 hypothetical protein [Gluconacetobacter sacchari]GBQ24905.1 hypothetical protein AA12717_1925 [Gluconacetobacter sacchari DSM 12717]